MIPESQPAQLETQHATRSMPFRKKPWLWFSCLLLTGWGSGAHAQSVWTYEVVGPDNKTTTTFKPPMDISYPAANASMPVYNPNQRQGIPLTAQEAAARLLAPKLIILLGPDFR